MTADSIVLLVLTTGGFLGFVALLVKRIQRNGLHRPSARRWLLIDILLVLMSAEVLLDTLVDVAGSSDVVSVIHLVAVAFRGASVAGVLSLLATFPQSDEPPRRRFDASHVDYSGHRTR